MQDRNNQGNRPGQNRSNREGKWGNANSQIRPEFGRGYSSSRQDAEQAFSRGERSQSNFSNDRDMDYRRTAGNNYNQIQSQKDDSLFAEDERFFGNEDYETLSYSGNNTGSGSYQNLPHDEYTRGARNSNYNGRNDVNDYGKYDSARTSSQTKPRYDSSTWGPNHNPSRNETGYGSSPYSSKNNGEPNFERPASYGVASSNRYVGSNNSAYGNASYGSGSNLNTYNNSGNTWSGNTEQDRSLNTHYGKGPKNYKRTDTRIQEEVNDALYADHHIDASEIEVAVKDGIVTLSGKVSDRKMKRLAEDLVENIQGVTDVRNEISTGGLLGNIFGDKNKNEKTQDKTDKKLM